VASKSKLYNRSLTIMAACRLSIAIVACAAGLWAFQAPATNSGVHPLTGRQIAGVCGFGGCETWLERPEREQEENPDGALDALNLKAGMSVADVGAGTGYMSLKLSKRVGPAGKVYAEDVQPEMLQKVRTNAAKAKASNVVTVQGSFTDPMLPKGQMDLVLLVDVYHEFSEPQKMLRGIRESLKPDGRLVLLEYRKEDPKIPIREEHKMTVAEVRTELEAEGFHLAQVIETLPRQHILILTKTGR
jgi:SAM-dependent methyltransferase